MEPWMEKEVVHMGVKSDYWVKECIRKPFSKSLGSKV